MIIKKDDIFLVTIGEYSSYYVQTMLKAKTDVNIEELKKDFDKLWQDKFKDRDDIWRFNVYTEFLRFLVVNKDLFDELQYKELYLGGYNEIDPQYKSKVLGHYRQELNESETT